MIVWLDEEQEQHEKEPQERKLHIEKHQEDEQLSEEQHEEGGE